MGRASKFLEAASLAVLEQSASADVDPDSRLNTVLDRGSLLCSGHNRSLLGFAEVDDSGNWKGVDIDLCRALAAGLFGSLEGKLEIVPISWAQRWTALQSGDIDVVIKVSGWTQSRDNELNLAFSRPYFIGAFQTTAHTSLGAETMADLTGGTICVAAGTSTERATATYLETKAIDAELLTFENGDELRNAYFEGRCDGLVEWAPSLAAGRADAPDGADSHVILPDVIAIEAEGIITISIYGAAYIAEIVRAGFNAIPVGQSEAGRALGLSNWYIFSRIRPPLALRIVMPTMINQYLWLFKATTIGIAISFTDYFMGISTAINQSGQTLELIALLMGGFLLINYTMAWVLNRVNDAIALKGTQLRI